MDQKRVMVHHVEGYFVTFCFLCDEEHVIFFHNNQTWLAQVKHKEDDLFEVVDYRFVLLGDQKQVDYPVEEYVKKLIKHLKNTSLYSYIIQKYLYDDQDFDWRLTNL